MNQIMAQIGEWLAWGFFMGLGWTVGCWAINKVLR